MVKTTLSFSRYCAIDCQHAEAVPDYNLEENVDLSLKQYINPGGGVIFFFLIMCHSPWHSHFRGSSYKS